MQTKAAILGALTLLSASLIGGIGPVAANEGVDAVASDRARLRCTATSSGDSSMSAKYDQSGSRRKFSVEVEARIGGGSGIVVGDVLRVKVGTVIVTGSPTPAIRFTRVVGDVVADLNFDTVADAVNEHPFPTRFPASVGGKVIEASVVGKAFKISCRLPNG